MGAWLWIRLRTHGLVGIVAGMQCDAPVGRSLNPPHFALPPQRHRYVLVTRATTRPVPLVISRLPVTRSGPSTCGSTVSIPSRTGSMSVCPLPGSPVAENSIT